MSDHPEYRLLTRPASDAYFAVAAAAAVEVSHECYFSDIGLGPGFASPCPCPASSIVTSLVRSSTDKPSSTVASVFRVVAFAVSGSLVQAEVQALGGGDVTSF